MFSALYHIMSFLFCLFVFEGGGGVGGGWGVIQLYFFQFLSSCTVQSINKPEQYTVRIPDTNMKGLENIKQKCQIL